MALIKKSTAAEQIGQGRSSIERLIKCDPSFPRPIKMGEHRQSAVFFDDDELKEWIEAQKAKRAPRLEVIV